jgi:hypothetical protein
VQIKHPILAFVVVLFISTGLPAQTRYFPEKTFAHDARMDQFVSHWYSGQLEALQEPSLFEKSKRTAETSYRFLWLRTFHHPIAIRVDMQNDGTAILTTKVASGAGGYNPGKLVTNKTRPLTKSELSTITSRIETSNFWTIPSYSRDQGGADGSEWVIEIAEHGKYHLVSEWTPKDGTIHELGEVFLFDLAKMTDPKSEVY